MSVTHVIHIGYRSLRLRQVGVNDHERQSHKETGVRGTGEAVTGRESPRH